MILTDYYKMRVLKVRKSHRFDCVASTGEYEPFEMRASRAREKRFYCYYNGVPDTFSVEAQRKAERALTDGHNITSVYIPDIEQPLKGYGDMVGTNDGLLLLFSSDYNELEIFVARGYKNDIKALCSMFLDGEIDGEVEAMRAKVSEATTNPPSPPELL